MPKPPKRLVRILLFLLPFLGFTLHSPSPATAAEDPKPVTQGYVTSLSPPDGFVLNGNIQVTTSSATTYIWFGSKSVADTPAPSDALQVGTFVQVAGSKQKDAVSAASLALRNLDDKTLKGYGLIDKVIATGPVPVFRADGYRIRLASSTSSNFSAPLKSISDVGTNDWVHYEGKLDNSGDLVATRADFSSGKTGIKSQGQRIKDAARPVTIPPTAVIIDASGNFKDGHEKLRLNNKGGQCGWHRLVADPAMQQRVQRIGMSVVPDYQRQLSPDTATSIHFRFFAVDEPEYRSEFSCDAGLVLVPRLVMDRLENDDQLAAVLADGVAAHLQMQSRKLFAEHLGLASASVAGDIAEQFIPLIAIANLTSSSIAQRTIELQMEEQRGRMSLALMEDAGYNPWAAPEAWRLLDPKNLPKDLSDLKYPNRSGYLLAILHQQYKSAASPPAAP